MSVHENSATLARGTARWKGAFSGAARTRRCAELVLSCAFAVLVVVEVREHQLCVGAPRPPAAHTVWALAAAQQPH